MIDYYHHSINIIFSRQTARVSANFFRKILFNENKSYNNSSVNITLPKKIV